MPAIRSTTEPSLTQLQPRRAIWATADPPHAVAIALRQLESAPAIVSPDWEMLGRSAL